jgi:molybdenum cofactor guanylyltransferase
MNVLGAILAGGEARRFGSDKALAMLDGVTLIDRVRAALTPQVAAVVVCGRVGGIADRPAGIGPLGGIAAAIWQARERGMDGAVTVPCDAPGLPDDLVARLAAAGGVSGGAAFVAAMPVVGYWPATLAEAVDAHVAAGGNWSIRRWAEAIGAVGVELPGAIDNVNTRADLERIERGG